jgi:TolB-like protein/class 3 adenylate cyclase/Tfp pilus assembly protein PilF
VTASRRLAAILAADVVGYSRLMGEDEAGTAQAVRERREAATPLVRSHGGRIVKTMGDGVLLEFPSVVAAVECAIAIQKLMVERNTGVRVDKCIVYRMGMHIGDVIVDGDDILGDGVNIAARLEGIAEPGGICLSASAYEHVQGRVKVDFTDLGDKELKNIARPVRVYALGPLPLVAALNRPTDWPVAGSPRLSIVVLPFENISGDASQDYFVDGVTATLTTDLSRIGGSFVIGRSTAFTYKGKPIDAKQIGRELNVRYVLEGSVQRGGDRVRVNVQLVDVGSGAHFWSDRFDKPIADLFVMQDEIVARLANQLRAELNVAEARRAGRTANPDSMDLYFQGYGCLNNRLMPDYLRRARSCFEQALALDPENADALVSMASMDVSIAGTFADDWAERLLSAENAFYKALSLVPNHAIAHTGLATVFNPTHRATQGLAEAELALTLDSNLAIAHYAIGQAKFYLGRPEEVESSVREAMRLSPRDRLSFSWYALAGVAALYVGDYEEGLAWLRRSIESHRSFLYPHLALAGALANLGQLDEARAAAQAALSLDPNFTINRLRARASALDHPRFWLTRSAVLKGCARRACRRLSWSARPAASRRLVLHLQPLGPRWIVLHAIDGPAATARLTLQRRLRRVRRRRMSLTVATFSVLKLGARPDTQSAPAPLHVQYRLAGRPSSLRLRLQPSRQ